jgi:hypothetical protein
VADAGEVRGGDLGQVLDIEQGQLQVCAADEVLDLRGAQRGDPAQVSGGDVLASVVASPCLTFRRIVNGGKPLEAGRRPSTGLSPPLGCLEGLT